MRFKIKKRDNVSRLAEISSNDKRIITPNVFFIDTDRVSAPDFSELIYTNKKNINSEKLGLRINDRDFNDLSEKGLKISNLYDIYKPTLSFESEEIEINSINENDDLGENNDFFYIIQNSVQLYRKPRSFTDFIIKLKEKFGSEKTFFLPGVARTNNLSLLSYMGLDLFDTSSLILDARDKIMQFDYGSFSIDNLKFNPCSCPVCSNLNKKTSEMDFNEILSHNYFVFLNELNNVRNNIINSNIRNLVELRCKSDPLNLSILRNLDINYYDFFERFSPIRADNTIYANSKESYLRPEIIRFQRRVIHRLKKPSSSKILLLLPCSARKPYSFSKSHRFFRNVLLSSVNPHTVHEIIITSPIGIVPRELELVYPASSYDISVTGLWDEDERLFIRNLLSDFLKNNSYDMIISHLPDNIMVFLKDLLKNAKKTCIDSPTSDISLKSLSKTLDESVGCFDKVNFRNRAWEDMLNFACFQFGRPAAEVLLKDAVIKGKYPFLKLMQGNVQLGMIVPDRGFISLTINGAKRIADLKEKYVKVSDDFELVGSIFAPGVIDSDEKIRIGDEVFIFQKNEFFGVGIALMNGEDMKNCSYGEAVKIRHHI